MEPRYKRNWLAHRATQFKGGIERFDIWLNTDNDVRIAWGESNTEWHWLSRLLGSTKYLLNTPTPEELQLIQHYVKLFIPEVGTDGTEV